MLASQSPVPCDGHRASDFSITSTGWRARGILACLGSWLVLLGDARWPGEVLGALDLHHYGGMQCGFQAKGSTSGTVPSTPVVAVPPTPPSWLCTPGGSAVTSSLSRVLSRQMFSEGWLSSLRCPQKAHPCKFCGRFQGNISRATCTVVTRGPEARSHHPRPRPRPRPPDAASLLLHQSPKWSPRPHKVMRSDTFSTYQTA